MFLELCLWSCQPWQLAAIVHANQAHSPKPASEHCKQMFVCVSMCVYMWLCAHVSMCICRYICLCVCLYVHVSVTYVCTHVCIWVETSGKFTTNTWLFITVITNIFNSAILTPYHFVLSEFKLLSKYPLYSTSQILPIYELPQSTLWNLWYHGGGPRRLVCLLHWTSHL